MIEKSDLIKKYEDALRKREQPGFVKPMLATLTDDYFDDPDWIYERKLDGERCLVIKHGDRVELFSRNEKK